MAPRYGQSMEWSSFRNETCTVQAHTLSHVVRVCTRQTVVIVCLLLSFPLPLIYAKEIVSPSYVKSQTIPILGTIRTHNWKWIGMVAKIDIHFENRQDHEGLRIHFETQPGQFSTLAQQSVTQAIIRVAEVSHSTTESWSVILSLPYPGTTMYGESLSAMVGLCVLALAKGDPLPTNRVVTGTVTADGHLGIVGGIPLKIVAAHKEHLRKVIISEEQDIVDMEGQISVLMDISSVDSISQAYHALTDRPISTEPSASTTFTLH